ncbi:MAG: FGGY-family carbohydrate kinase, partial [Anaerolineae bacterium]
MSLLGLDIGTTGCKAIVFREDGSILASAYREYPLMQPQPGWIELDAELVWSRVEESIREAVAKAGPADPVCAVAPSVQGEAVCPVDASGRPLANSIVTFDNRTVAQAEQLGAAVGAEALYRLSGQPLHPMGTVNKIAWWRQNRPDIYRAASRFLCYGDFALARLGVEPVMDTSMAARTMAYDLRAGVWSQQVLSAFDIDVAKLPRVTASGEAVGEMPHAVCDRLSLPHGVLAVTGGHDQPCGALGAGAAVPGRAMYAIGT